jgi:hypothetical protein
MYGIGFRAKDAEDAKEFERGDLEQRDGRLGGSYGLTSRVRHTPGLVYF